MRTKAVLIALAVAVALGQAAFAKHDRDDDDERHPGKGWAKGWDHKGGPRESGPYTRFENSAERYVYEFRDASCRYKYEYSYRSGRSKVEQSGDCRGIAFPQRVVMQGREPLPRAIPPEVTRFSTMKGWPSVSESWAATRRATRSLAPPGLAGTTIRTGLLG